MTRLSFLLPLSLLVMGVSSSAPPAPPAPTTTPCSTVTAVRTITTYIIRSTTVSTTITVAPPDPSATTSTPVPTTTKVYAGHWTQCGGFGYTGPTECEPGLTCIYQNIDYWQCL